MKKFDFLKNTDKTISPGDDFFAYVNNSWIKKNPIPSDQSSWAIYHVVRDETQANLKGILDSLGSVITTDSALVKLRDFYRTGMDEKKLNISGTKHVMNLLSKIDGIGDFRGMTKVVAELHIAGIDVVWSNLVEPDDKDSSRYILRLLQSGLGMPDREYYIATDDRSKDVRNKYISHISKLSALFGESCRLGINEAKEIVNIETRLALSSMSRVEQRDAHAMYNKVSLAKLESLAPNIVWREYFNILGVKEKNLAELLVNQPKFMKEINHLWATVSLDLWKKYLKWHVMSESAGYLGEDFVQERWKFTGKVLSGAKKIKPRWKRVISIVDVYMGDALGKLYVDKFFPPEAKRRMLVMVQDIFEAYRKRISNLEWMTSQTKKKALDKLNLINSKIGYPAKWEKYKKLKIDNNSYILNCWRAHEFALKKMLGKLGKPIDRKEWHMTAPTFNAYYWPNLNEIVFPAGILQPPSFDLEATDAMNYGAIGAVIGHELTHGFDDEGCKFDGHGNLKEWWNKEDKKSFDLKAKKLIKQYDQYEVIPGVYCNGSLTLGENIADIGGVAIAFDALQNRLEKTGKREIINGFTPEQQFFIANARDWAGGVRPEQERQNIITDPHSPFKLRVNAVLSNVDEFYKAFDLKPSSRLYRKPSDRTMIW